MDSDLDLHSIRIVRAIAELGTISAAARALGYSQPAISRVRAATLVVDVDTDQLFTPAQAAALTVQLRAAGARVERETVASIHGHDAFLIEWKSLGPLLTKALHLHAPSP